MLFQGDCWWWRSLFWWWQCWWPLQRWWRLKSLIVAARSEVYPGTLLETCNWGSRTQLPWWRRGYFGFNAYDVKICIHIYIQIPYLEHATQYDIHSSHDDHDEGGYRCLTYIFYVIIFFEFLLVQLCLTKSIREKATNLNGIRLRVICHLVKIFKRLLIIRSRSL